MPHRKLVPKSPPPTLRLVSKVKPAPKNILDEETESDNHAGDRPALPRRPAMRTTLTSNDRILTSASRGNPYTQDLSGILNFVLQGVLNHPRNESGLPLHS